MTTRINRRVNSPPPVDPRFEGMNKAQRLALRQKLKRKKQAAARHAAKKATAAKVAAEDGSPGDGGGGGGGGDDADVTGLAQPKPKTTTTMKTKSTSEQPKGISRTLAKKLERVDVEAMSYINEKGQVRSQSSCWRPIAVSSFEA
eukprot:SAG11_NODE_3006_length_2773_cov_2.627524_2_plen_145_part_00